MIQVFIFKLSIFYLIKSVIKLICSDEQQAKLFKINPSQYLDQLLLYLQKQLIKNVFVEEQYNNNEHKKLQLTRRLQNTHVMYNCIPYTNKIYKQFSQINSDDVGKWIVVIGTVIECTTKKTLQKSKLYECLNCKQTYRIRTTYQNKYKFQVPVQCTKLIKKQKSNSFFAKLFQFKKNKQIKQENQNNKQKNQKNQKNQDKIKLQKCGGTRFQPIQQGKICIDYQQLRIQQQFQYITSGKIPRTIIIIIQGDFQNQNTFRPGDDLTITGLLTYRYSRLKKQYHICPQLVLYSNYIVVQKTNKSYFDDQLTQIQSIIINTQSQLVGKAFSNLPSYIYEENQLSKQQMTIVKQLQFRNEIIKSFCPGIYGRNMVKLGLLLSLLGGVSIENQNSKIRGNSHALLIGQPGTGKSVLLKEIAKLSQRSFFTNGIGTTSAGLSVSHYKDGKDWMIEAGALVLADNGVCCIDELTLLSKQDEKALLQAMQQQTISSAKASVIGKLNARATVICACNPIRPGQKYDDQLDLQANTGLSIPLLTRFDMIFIMKDQHDISQDSQKCDHILSNFMNINDGYTFSSSKYKSENINLRSLLKECKELTPQLDNNQIFSVYYTQERKRDSKVKTARAFQSLCRIAQAHAKLMLRQQTNQLDCLTAIMLTENRYISTLEEYYEYLEQFNQKYHIKLT